MHPACIKAILFDKDGTMFDYQRTWAPINRAAAKLATADDVALARRLLHVGGTDLTTKGTLSDTLLPATFWRSLRSG